MHTNDAIDIPEIRQALAIELAMIRTTHWNVVRLNVGHKAFHNPYYDGERNGARWMAVQACDVLHGSKYYRSH